MRIIRSFESGTASVTGLVSGTPVFMVEVNGEVLLPVEPGYNFGLRLRNKTYEVRAFPAVVGDGQKWINVYAKCPVLDPSKMPSTGGMWEVRGRDDSKPNRKTTHDLSAFELPGDQELPWIAEADGLGYEGAAANQIIVWERPPADPNAVIATPPAQPGGLLGVLLGTSDAHARGSRSAGPVIGAGAAQSVERQVTNLDYLEATKLAHVRIVTRDQVAELARQHGVTIKDWFLIQYRGEISDINAAELAN